MKNIEEIKKAIKNDVTKYSSSIGTKQEKNIHRFIKYYINQDSKYHEIKINNYYVDCFYNEMIYEIQTKSFNAIRDKIANLLKDYELTIVYPVTFEKQIINTQDGEIISSKKSPKKTHPLSICSELYKIKQLLKNENLHILFFIYNCEEYRYYRLNRYKRLTPSRIDQNITEIVSVIEINHLSKLKQFLPDTLPLEFTTKDLIKHLKVSKKDAGLIANILSYLEIIIKTRKIGNLFVYQINKSEH